MTITPRSLSYIAVLAALGTAEVAGAQGQVTAQAVSIGRWSGSLRGQTMSTAGDATRYSGSVEILPLVDGREGEYRVRIRISANNQAGDMEWSISPGRCGTKLQLLLLPGEVPPLEVRAAGNAEVSYDGLINLNTNATYHVPVFKDGHQQQNMVACADLKYKAPR